MVDKQLTSVKLNPELFEDFKVDGVKLKFSFQKLSERAMHLFMVDEEFRKQILNHTDLTYTKKY